MWGHGQNSWGVVKIPGGVVKIPGVCGQNSWNVWLLSPLQFNLEKLAPMNNGQCSSIASFRQVIVSHGHTYTLWQNTNDLVTSLYLTRSRRGYSMVVS